MIYFDKIHHSNLIVEPFQKKILRGSHGKTKKEPADKKQKVLPELRN